MQHLVKILTFAPSKKFAPPTKTPVDAHGNDVIQQTTNQATTGK